MMKRTRISMHMPSFAATLSLASFALLLLVAQHHVVRVECKTTTIVGGEVQRPPSTLATEEEDLRDSGSDYGATTSSRAGRHIRVGDTIPFLSSVGANRLLAKATRVVEEEEEDASTNPDRHTRTQNGQDQEDHRGRKLANNYGYGYNNQYDYEWGANDDDDDSYYDDDNGGNGNGNGGDDFYRYGGHTYYNRYGEYWNGEEGAGNNYAQNYGSKWNYWNGNENNYNNGDADQRQNYYGNGYNADGYNNGYYQGNNNGYYWNNNRNNNNNNGEQGEENNYNEQQQYYNNGNGGNGYYGDGNAGYKYNEDGEVESWDSEDWQNWQNYNQYKYNQNMYNQQNNNNNNNNKQESTSWMKRYSLKFEGCLDRRQNSGQKLLAKFRLCPAVSSCVLCPNAGEYIVPLSDLVEAYDEMQPTGMDMYGTNWESLVDCSPIFGGNTASYTAASYYGNNGQAAYNDDDAAAAQQGQSNSNSLGDYFVGASCVDGGVYLGTFKDAFCTKPAPDGTHEELMGYSLPTYNLVSKKCIACNSAVQQYGFDYEEEAGQYEDGDKWWNEYQGFYDAEGVCQTLYASAGKCESHMEGNPHPNNEACKFIHSGPWRIAKILIPFLLGLTCFVFLLYFLRIHIERCAGHDAASILNEPLHSSSVMSPPRSTPRNIQGGVGLGAPSSANNNVAANKASTFGFFHNFFRFLESSSGLPAAKAAPQNNNAVPGRTYAGVTGGKINPKPITKADSHSDTVSELTEDGAKARSWRIKQQQQAKSSSPGAAADDASKGTTQTMASKAADSITNQPFEVGQGNIWLNKTDVFKKRSEKLADALFAVSEEKDEQSSSKRKGFIV